MTYKEYEICIFCADETNLEQCKIAHPSKVIKYDARNVLTNEELKKYNIIIKREIGD